MSNRAYRNDLVTDPNHLHSISSYRSTIEAQIRNFPGSQIYLSRLDQYIRQATKSDTIQVSAFEYVGRTDDDAEQSAWQPVDITAQQLHTRIVVSDGFPSPLTIAQLGHRHQVRPEVFLGHLAFERVLSRDRTSFELPALPSTRGNIVHVSFMRLGRAVEEMDSDRSIAGVQAEIDGSCQDYERELFDEAIYSATRIRKVILHNRRYFSVQQDVTFCVSDVQANFWTGIYLLDKGNGLRRINSLPWKCFASKHDQSISFLPVVNYNAEVHSVTTTETTNNGGNDSSGGISIYHPLDDILSEADISLSAQSPFFLLCRLYRAALLSYVQVSNFLDEDTLRCQRTPVEDSSEGIELLRSRIDFTDSMSAQLHSCRETIEIWGSRVWPILTDSSVTRLDEIKQTLLQDFQHLIEQNQNISRRCERTVSLLLSSTSVAEAQKSMRQAENVAQLTYLAFYFFPVSLAASIFGMNVREINESLVRIWVFVVLAFGLTCCAIMFSRQEDIRQLSRGRFRGHHHR